VKRACIAVVDATRARIYTYQDRAELAPTEQLREEIDLVNPARRLRPSELFGDAHVDAMDAQFARDIVGVLERLVRAGGYAHVIVVASPKMLGELRSADGVLHRADVTLDEVPRDLVKLTSSQLHDHLARRGLVARRPHLAAAGAR
jgi:protein required for attachment to host cells